MAIIHIHWNYPNMSNLPILDFVHIQRPMQKLLGAAESLSAIRKAGNSFNVSNPIDTFECKTLSNKARSAQICKSTLSGNNPCETVVIYNAIDDNIEGIHKGNIDSCVFDCSGLKSAKDNYSILHCHPDAKFEDKKFYMPISFDDFLLLNNNDGIKEIVAYGVRDEETSLAKKDGFKKIKSKDIEGIKIDILKYLYKYGDDSTIEKVKELQTYCEKHPKKSNAVLNKAIDLVKDIAKTPDGAKAINEFWKDNASRYNLDYLTNL